MKESTTLDRMIDALRRESATIVGGWNEAQPLTGGLRLTAGMAEHRLARLIVGGSLDDLADDEVEALIEAAREEYLTNVVSSPGGAILVEAAAARARRGLGRATEEDEALLAQYQVNDDEDDVDAADSLDAALDVLALGLVRLSRADDEATAT